jgi:hypothetical protein
MSIEVMRQALEALESYEQYIQPLTNCFGGPEVPREGSASAKVKDAITVLRAAIEQAEKPQRACSGCDKTNNSDSMWAVYCVDCWNKTAALPDINPEALEEVEVELKQDPVAWRWKALVNGEFVSNWVLTHSEPPPYATESMPLYTAPRQWVELTDDEARALVNRATFGDKTNWQALVYIVDARLKEKNHG